MQVNFFVIAQNILGKKWSCGMKSGEVEYSQGTRQFYLEEMEHKQQIRQKHQHTHYGRQTSWEARSVLRGSWMWESQTTSPLPLVLTQEWIVHFVPFVPPQTLQVTVSFTSKPNVTVKLQC